MKFLFRVSIIAILSTQSIAQVYDFGDIPNEHLEMTVYEKDSSANAVVLFDIGNSVIRYQTNKGFKLIYKRHTRYKVLEDAGVFIADVEIKYRHDDPKKDINTEQDIKKIQATSYTLTNGSIIEQNFNEDDIYTEVTNEYWSEIKFSIPGVKKGSIIEVSYEMEMDFLLWFPNWYFQRNIPTLWSEYSTKIPEFYTFSYQTLGAENLFVEESDTYSDRARITYTVNNTADRLGNSSMGQRYTETVNFEGKILRFVMKDVPALPDEPFTHSRKDYEARTDFQFISLQYPDQLAYFYSRPWDELIDDLLGDINFGRKIKSSDDIKREVDYLTYGVESNTQKMENIYNYVATNVTWNGNYGMFLNENTPRIFRDKRGSSTELNMLLLQMLKDAGLSAYPLIVSTKENGSVNTLVGVADQFNHALVYVDMGDQAYILDATDKNRPHNLLPTNVLGTEGLLLFEEKIIWIPISNYTRNSSMKMVTINLHENGYTGNIKSQQIGYFAKNLREEYNAEDSLASLQNLIFKNSFTKVTSVSAVNDEFEHGFNYTLEFENEEAPNSDIRYFNPMMVDRTFKNPFTLEERFSPVDFNYTSQQMINANIILPEGWVVEELPKPMIYRLPDNSAEFQRILQAGNGTIMMRFVLKINKPLFLPDEYEGLKDMYDKLVKAHAENIVIKKES